MSWAALTADEIKTRLSGPEVSALQNSALATGQTDPLPDVLLQVTDEVRGYIAASNRNVLGPAGTIPPQLRGAAIAIARWRFLGRLSVGSAGSLMQSEPRRKEYEDAMSLLRDVSKGKFVIEQPAVQGPEEIPASDSTFGSDEQLDF